MPQTLHGKIARGATWMLLFRLTDRGLAFFSTIILARVLVPADFGLVAMAMSVIALIELTGAFSLEVALIQRPSPTRQYYDTTWTLRMFFGVFGALGTAAMAYPAAQFYADDRIPAIMFVLAVNWLIGSVENIGVVNFRRDLDFRREFYFLISKRLAAMPVTLTLAIAFHTYWALIVGTLVGTAMTVILSYTMQSYRPRFSLAASRELMSFSVWLFIFNLLAFLQARLPHFVIGRTLGAEPLGIFTVATDFAALASSEITAPINRAVMPGLSRMAEGAGGIQEGMKQVTAAVLLITLPAAFGLVAIAEPLVLTLLGGQWLGAVPVLQVLAFAGALHTITANNHSAYLAAAKARVSVIISGTFVLVLIPLLFAFKTQGVVGVALAHLGAMASAVGVSIALMRRHIGTTFGTLLQVAWRPFLAASLMGAAVFWLDQNHFGLGIEPPPYVRLVAGAIAGVVLYVPLVISLWLVSGRGDGPEAYLVDRALAALRRTGPQ
jgi:O-antigen/teichoic acid export membrane protein